MSLFPYQKEGVKWLASRNFALLADEPGLGKTVQAIAACEGLDRILVLCPASLRGNWAREFSRFQRTSRSIDAVLGKRPVGCGVTIASYDFAARYATELAGAYDALILDESHALKNYKSKRTQAVFGMKTDRGLDSIAANADRVYCLSGTPAPNNPSELYPVVRALAPELLDVRQRTLWGFIQKYCRTRDTGFGLQITGGKNLGELKERLAPFILRRKKADVLPDLPPLRLETLYLDGVLSRELSALSKEYGGQIEAALEEGIEGLAKIAPHVARLRRLTGALKVAGTVETVINEVPYDGKIVLFAYHTDVIHSLQAELVAAGFGVVVVDGGCPAGSRHARVEQFQTDPATQVFIGQLTAAGVGLTLTAASEAIIVESSWVPAENEQAAMRIHRIGQNRACRVRFATLADSLDEKINRAVLRKAADIATLFN